MPPTLALGLWVVCLLGLMRYDPARAPGTSLALFVPLIQFLIVGSRLPSTWLGSQLGIAAQAMEEGSPLDRTVDAVLILLAVGILMSRSFKWDRFLTRNVVLLVFMVFALVSVMWSDFPFVAFKRWARDLGGYMVLLVILAEAVPLEAFRTMLRRVFFLLITLSILLDKYYPGLSKQYDPWSGRGYYVGATTSKNMLGVLCLVSGLFFFWDILTRWRDRQEWRTRRIILVNVVFIFLTLWVLDVADSATSRVCLALGCFVIAMAHTGTVKKHPAIITWLIPVAICAYAVLTYGFGDDIMGGLARSVGRNPTLTGRTEIWKTVLSINTNPVVGTGYESFWLGPRLHQVWEAGSGTEGINEAHNGYLEVYLDLGLVGLSLLVGFLIASYRRICKRLTPSSSLGSLGLALWTVLVFYNMTEAAFLNGLLWMTFLLGAMAVDERGEESSKSPPGITPPARRSDLSPIWMKRQASEAPVRWAGRERGHPSHLPSRARLKLKLPPASADK
jgi:exopolysaccharide production protein ExoQ